MSRKTEVMTAVGTFVCAIGVGFIMQNGEVAEQRYGSVPVSPAFAMPIVGKSVAAMRPSSQVDSKPLQPIAMQDITLTSAQVPTSDSLKSPLTAIDVVADADVFDLYLAPQDFWGGLLVPELEKMPDCPISATV